MTVRENLELGAFTLRGPAASQAVERVLAQFPLLAAKLPVLAGNLSGGEQQILETAMVLEAGPELLLLDEPSQGLAPMVVNAVMSTIRELKAERVSMLLVEQNAEMALQLADRVYVIDHGTVVFEGTPERLRADRQVTATYLGVGG
jgi:branched-chain amino acid transport system ATP-binding protein